MVRRAWGTANGETIYFDRAEGDRWEAKVPWTDDGEYAAELYAEDDAGNTGFLCSMLFVISGHEMQAYVVPRGFSGTGDTNAYSGPVSIGEFFGTVREAPFNGSGRTVEYQGEIGKGGYFIEHTVCIRDIH